MEAVGLCSGARTVSRVIYFNQLSPIGDIRGEDAEETSRLKLLHENARSFIKGFDWCGDIACEYFGLGIGDVVGVFLFEIDPAKAGIDRWLWVIIGDLPPAYIVTDLAPDPVSALRVYVQEMRKWVEAIRQERSVDGIIPVNAAPTIENAEMLEGATVVPDKRNC